MKILKILKYSELSPNVNPLDIVIKTRAEKLDSKKLVIFCALKKLVIFSAIIAGDFVRQNFNP